MTEATLAASGDDVWMLGGVLDFATVPTVWTQLERLLKAGGTLTLSLAEVVQANSAGLVMLVEARDLARQSHCRLRLVEVPPGLIDLARISGCETLITQDAA